MEAEVCIVGAGAAGGIMALELARRGVGVAVLESGPRHDFGQRREYVRRYLEHENPWQTPLPGLDRYTGSGATSDFLAGKRARGVGGSTLHWEGYALRLHADDFRMRSLYGIADDWPISYQDLEPYYARAEQALGVAGAADDPWASPRSAAFPLPAFPFSYSDGLLARACRSLGIALHSLPQARNSVAYGGRSQCRACGTCHVCPTGAKASTDLTHIPEAEATGKARVLTDATVLRLETDRAGNVSAAVYARPDKVEQRVSARVFVVAAGAVENARLLLLSPSREFPDGLANRSGLVGKFFMSHPSVDVTGRASEKVHPYRIGFSTAMSRQFAVERDRAARGAFNAVSLNPRVRDYFGSPVPHLHYNVGRYELKALDEGKAVARKIFAAMGLTDISSGGISFAGHLIGTHRMGADPHTSVLEPNLRAHDVPNLYLVGSGCFVTASASPPTLTIAAMAIRAAEHIAARLRSGGRGAPGASLHAEDAIGAPPHQRGLRDDPS